MFLLQTAVVPTDLSSGLTNSVNMGSFGGGALGSMFAIMGIFMVIVAIIAVVIAILNLMNIYHWGTADNAAFEKVGETKKKWFINLILMPIIASVIMAIPFVGWVIGGIIYIYFVVMILIYFFGTKNKINKGA